MDTAKYTDKHICVKFSRRHQIRAFWDVTPCCQEDADKHGMTKLLSDYSVYKITASMFLCNNGAHMSHYIATHHI